jgi:hypothetical protein
MNSSAGATRCGRARVISFGAIGRVMCVSAAGRTFTSRTLKAGWAARYGHTSVVDAFGAIYVLGSGGSTYYRDVWASTNGGARPDSVNGVVGGTRGGYSRGTKGY